MRYLSIILLVLFFAMPVHAASTYCSMDGPHNCVAQNEDQLLDITKNTINQMQLTHEQHAFKTQNDAILQAAVNQHARLDNSQIMPAFSFGRR